MDELEKLLRGWHGCISMHPNKKPAFRCSLMREDGCWFEGDGMSLKTAARQAIREAEKKVEKKAV